jgi:hypothetical protein
MFFDKEHVTREGESRKISVMDQTGPTINLMPSKALNDLGISRHTTACDAAHKELHGCSLIPNSTVQRNYRN